MRWLLWIIVLLLFIACITAAVFWWRSYGRVDTLSLNLKASRYCWSSRSPVPGYFFFERLTGTTAEAIAQTEEMGEGIISFKTRKKGSFKSGELHLMGMGDNEKKYWARVQRYDGPWKIEALRAGSQ